MNIGTIPTQAFPTFGFAITAANNGRMSLPVAPGQVIYSHFKHISGTPAPEGTRGVNISRLKILNTLIDQLERLKGQDVVRHNMEDERDENRINALIDQYQKQIKATQSAGGYSPAAPATGLLFSIAA